MERRSRRVRGLAKVPSVGPSSLRRTERRETRVTTGGWEVGCGRGSRREMWEAVRRKGFLMDIV